LGEVSGVGEDNSEVQYTSMTLGRRTVNGSYLDYRGYVWKLYVGQREQWIKGLSYTEIDDNSKCQVSIGIAQYEACEVLEIMSPGIRLRMDK
jgi:hypothetical protein